MRKGIKTGIKIGKQRGKIKEKTETAMKGFKNGLSDELIQSLTELSLSEIKELRKQFEISN